ncbi:MAG: hypothetical protein KDH09_18230 [Chrysiogenetes bacterium]|nr:hypothetical protein [Chrysiogenetes bacterium]
MSGEGDTLLTEGLDDYKDEGDPGAEAPVAEKPAEAPAAPKADEPKAGDGTFDWRQHLSPELRDDPTIGKYDTLDGFAKSHVNLSKLLGGDKVPKPRDENDQEGWDRWYAASGRPESADKYEFEVPASAPEGFYQEEASQSFRNWAFANGLSQKQAQNLHDSFVKDQLERYVQGQVAMTEAKAEAERNYRRAKGSTYEAEVAKARAAMSTFATEEVRAKLTSTGLGNDPVFIDMFARIGDRLVGESRLRGPSAPTAPMPEDIERSIADYRARNHAALYDSNHPAHDHHVKELWSLTQKRHGA